ncbi:splicing factor [Dimargaris verticillata]|uniref:Splicing factor n=1 Tax=Dimargaris verticillata TaxID=2761393 RepID=A0A9W8BD63_9FUNG|nr:splicing factor [Dimargaris verticillata]
MADYARSLIQELMSPYDGKKQVHFSDRNVCKHYLVGFCPYQLFPNTKADLGTCDKVHDDKLRKDYLAAPDREDYDYEYRFFLFLRSLCDDLDHRIERAHRRLHIKPMDDLANPRRDEMEEKMVLLDERIKKLLADAEAAGEDGQVDKAKDLSDQAEHLKERLEQLKHAEVDHPLVKQEKQMEVCKVCGGFLVTGDDSKRLDAHNEGKQHSGYLLIRTTYDELKHAVRTVGAITTGSVSVTTVDIPPIDPATTAHAVVTTALVATLNAAA